MINRRRALIISVLCVGAASVVPISAQTVVQLDSPPARSVFQRAGNNSTDVSIVGRLDSSVVVTSIEARATPVNGGVAVDWTLIDTAPSANSFQGSLTLSAGWYRLQVRSLMGTAVTGSAQVDLMGVGEVFVVAGQSNSANFGDPVQIPDDERVSTVDLSTFAWEPAIDPQPNADGRGGSPWPEFGDLLASQENVPVGIISVGQGGVSVAEWQPNAADSLYTDRLLPALNYVRNVTGVRAILWHQGEQDALIGTSTTAYQQLLTALIAQSRADLGFQVPWGVARASATSTTGDAVEAAIVAGQQAVIDADPLVFGGPATNDYGARGFLHDGLHFNQDGLDQHARQWLSTISDLLEIVEVLPAITPTGEGLTSSDSFSVGWEFTVDETTNVSQLGRITRLGATLGADSPAAIYRLDSGEAVASATIGATMMREPLGAFYQVHYASLANTVSLEPGINYAVLVEAVDGAGFGQDVPADLAPGINYVAGRATAPGEGLPANANDSTLPATRNVTGFSYLGATFRTGLVTTPPPQGDSLNAVLPNSEGVISFDQFSVGWEFTVSQPTRVAKLGRITRLGDSLEADSNAAIYRLDTGAAVATALVPAPTQAQTIGSIYQAHYAALASPVTLEPGIPYVILVEALDGVGFSQDVPVTLGSGIRYITGRATPMGETLPSVANNTTVPITRNVTGMSYLGPIFQLASDDAPDPNESNNAATPTAEGIASFDAFSVGFEFTVSQIKTVAKLGRVSEVIAPIIADSPVAIYRLDTGAVVASATVLATTAGEALGSIYQVQYANLAPPVVLEPGIRYVILTEALDGAGFSQDVPATLASGINYTAGRATNAGESLPAVADNTTVPNARAVTGISYFGAMFQLGDDSGPDIGSPQVVLSAPAVVAGDFQVVVNFNEAVSGLTLDDLIVINGTPSDLTGSGAGFAFTVAPQRPGRVFIALPPDAVVDAAGNGNAASNQLAVTFQSSIPGRPLSWVESFDDLAVGTTADNGDTAWTAVRDDGLLGVRGGRFEVFANGTEGLWNSEVIDISATVSVDISLNIQGLGNLDKSGIFQDYLRVFYRLDGGPEVLIAERFGKFNNRAFEPLMQRDLAGSQLQIVIRALVTGPDEIYSWDNVAVTGEGIAAPTGESLGDIDLPLLVDSPSRVTVHVPYTAGARRELEIVLHDVENEFAVLAKGSVILEAGSGVHVFSVPVRAHAREGSGHVWAVRLLPIDWISADDAIDAVYADVTVQTNPNAAPEQDIIANFTAPTRVVGAGIATLSVDFEATAERELLVWLQDSQDNWRTVGEGVMRVGPGIGLQTFSVGIAADARVGGGYVWAARLRPVGGEDNLSERFIESTVTAQSGDAVVNFAVLPTANSRQSSVFGGFTAHRAKDGNTDGDWRNNSVIHTELEANAWWELDLGVVRDVDHILVWNRTDCCPDRLSSYFVLVSDVPFVSQDLDATLNQPGVDAFQFNEAPMPTQRVAIDRPARYVRIQLAGANYLSLAEVEVFGSLNGALVNGVTYEYFEGDWTTLPDFDTLSPVLTGTRLRFDLDAQQRADLFGFRFRGCLTVPADGDYTFYSESDDGSRLLIGGAVVVDNDGLHDGPVEASGVASLTAGTHLIELQYFSRLGEESIKVQWTGPNFSKRPIGRNDLTINETGVSPEFRHAGHRIAAGDNTDGDLLDLTAEYALGRDPSIAWMEDLGLNVESAGNGESVNVWYRRPARLDEISYTLEVSNNLIDWFELEAGGIQAEPSGWERVTYVGLEQLDQLSIERGFVRLRLYHDGWNHETTTPVCGWLQSSLRQGYQTHGISLNHEPVFSSKISSIDSTATGATVVIAHASGILEAIAPGGDYYLEITSGAYEGHRIDIDEASASGITVAVDLTSPHNTLTTIPAEDLMGAGFDLRAHRTLGGAYPSTIFTASADPSKADQLQFWSGGQYATYFLLQRGADEYWTNMSSTTLANEDERLLPPGTGCFIQRAEGAHDTKLLVTGHVRTGAFIQPLRQGYNLLASPFPENLTPSERGMSISNGFVGSNTPIAADQLQFWAGDRNQDAQGFIGMFLLDGGSDVTRFWTETADSSLAIQDHEELFLADRAFFVKAVGVGHPDYRIAPPAAWAP